MDSNQSLKKPVGRPRLSSKERKERRLASSRKYHQKIRDLIKENKEAYVRISDEN